MQNADKIMDLAGITFDDVLLLPGYAEGKRRDIDLSANLTPAIRLSIPIVSSPMDTVTGSEMAIALGRLGGAGILHRSMTKDEQAGEVRKIKNENLTAVAAVGTGEDMKERAECLVKAGADALLIDSAHGYSRTVLDTTRYLSSRYKNTGIISGNTATYEGAEALIKHGAKALRAGMGPGAICTTRIVSGTGVPQITAIMEVVRAARKYRVPVIADGGIRNSGDIVKALSAGASSVMLGSLLAGCKESLGKMREISGKKYKYYRGMGSVIAMKEGGAARYGQDYKKGEEKKLTAEGVESYVPYKGEVISVVENLEGGIRSGFYYIGAGNLDELYQKARFIRVSPASITESHPHDVTLL